MCLFKIDFLLYLCRKGLDLIACLVSQSYKYSTINTKASLSLRLQAEKSIQAVHSTLPPQKTHKCPSIQQ